MFKAFAIDTSFITNYGIKTFNDFVNGQKIQVMDKDGLWRKATVRRFNMDDMQQITFKKGDITKTVDCSIDHKWILDNGIITKYLTKGQKLYPFAHGMYYNISTTEKKVTYDQISQQWQVLDVRIINSNGIACCVEEPITHSFCLEGNIVTLDCY